MGIMSLILLNALLAIIVDSYGAVKEQSMGLTPEILPRLLAELAGRPTPPRPLHAPVEALDAALGALLDGGSSPLAAPCDARSARVLFCDLDDAKPVVLDQGLLKAALAVATGRDEDLDALCYNVMEQQGVDPEAELSTSDAQDQALLALDELSIFQRFEPALDDISKLLLVLQAAYGASEVAAAAAMTQQKTAADAPSIHSGSDKLHDHHAANHRHSHKHLHIAPSKAAEQAYDAVVVVANGGGNGARRAS